MNAKTAAATAEFASTLLDTMVDTAAATLAAGQEPKDVFESLRDWMSDRLGYSPLAAANMARLVLASVYSRVGVEVYSDADIDTIAAIVRAN